MSNLEDSNVSWPAILKKIASLDSNDLRKLDAFLNQLKGSGSCGVSSSSAKLDWPRAPVHRLEGKGTFIVTAATLHKQHHFRTPDSLDHLQQELFAKADQYGWRLEAWAIFSNHYHFVGHALEDAKSLSPMLSHLHNNAAAWVNDRDQKRNRQVWHNFWETELTYEKSYLARLNYVHHNAVKHGLVSAANQYPWCSAGWFERVASRSQVKTIYGFKTDKLKVLDDFEVLMPESMRAEGKDENIPKR
jgi:putative transposase